MRTLVIANPGKRLDAFLSACSELGCPEPRIVHHAALLETTAPLADLPDEIDVRIDSFGRDAEVELGLLELGREPDGIAPRERRRGEMVAPAQIQRGWLRYLERLDAAWKPSWTTWNARWALGELFDKPTVSRRLREADVRVPDALDPGTTVESLRAALEASGWTGAFVKLACGSSAVGIVRLDLEREQAITTIERDGDHWFNTRKLIHLDERDAIDGVLELVAREGAHVEKAIDLARLDERRFDLRVLVVAGEPAFVVARQSAHPMTNLHLGGTRADLDRVRALVPTAKWNEAMNLAVRCAELYECFHLGVDIGFEAGTFTPYVFEANAFGDFLPRLKRDGLSVMAWELRARLGLGFNFSRK